MHRVISCVTNRVFVGLPTCRNPNLTYHAQRYALFVPLGAYVLRCTASWLKPIVGRLMGLYGRWHTYKYREILMPVVEQRLREHDARQADPEGSKTEPNDFLEWSIKQAEELGDPSLSMPKKLAERLLALNFAAIHTTSLAITGAIVEIVCNNKQEYIDEIREEISSVLAEHGGEWNKTSLAKMHKVDSTLRESMRLNSFVVLGLARKVKAKEGVDTPSGVHLPFGFTVGVPGYARMNDKGVWGEDGDQFKPFRFAEKRADESVGYVERARKSFPTTDKDYLAFGHGRNACPGRFFAATEVKLLFAYAVMNYDFKMETEKPADRFFGVLRLAPMMKKVWIR
ncbi:cytochrome P450, partial [Coniochaeta sp. 2T2.1]